MTPVATVFLWIGLAGFLSILAVIFCLWRRWPDVRLLLAVPGLWAVLGMVNNVLTVTGRLSPQGVVMWGAVHRLLAIVMIFGGLLSMWSILAAPDENDENDESDEDNGRK